MGLFKKHKHGGQESGEAAKGHAHGGGLELHMADEGTGAQRERRGALRVRLPGLEAAIVGIEKSLPVKDVSVMGAGLAFKGKKRIKAGVRFKVTLRRGDTVYAEAVVARVMRHEQGVLGVVWQEPDRHQSDGLHKIVLEAQKRMADQRKGKKQLPDDVMNTKL